MKLSRELRSTAPVRFLPVVIAALLAIAATAACDDGAGEPTPSPGDATATAQAGAVAAVEPDDLEVDTGKAVIDGREYTFQVSTCDVTEADRYQIEGQGDQADGGRVIAIAFGDVGGPEYQVEVRVFQASSVLQADNDYLVGRRTVEPIPFSSADTHEFDPAGVTHLVAGTFYDGATNERDVPGAFGVRCDPG